MSVMRAQLQRLSLTLRENCVIGISEGRTVNFSVLVNPGVIRSVSRSARLRSQQRQKQMLQAMAPAQLRILTPEPATPPLTP
jgi:hypothetical protein